MAVKSGMANSTSNHNCFIIFIQRNKAGIYKIAV